MQKRDVETLRGTLGFLEREKELLTIKGPVDTLYEVSGILKSLEGGPAVLFENIKGFPGTRNVGNLFSTKARMAKIFGATVRKDLMMKCVEAVRHPLPPREVTDAPCQEVVITPDIDIPGTMPIIKHTPDDAGRVLGSGIVFIDGRYFNKGTHLSFNRMHFQGKDWSSLSLTLQSHLEWVVLENRGKRIPLTVNIAPSMAVMISAGTSYPHAIVPVGADEVGIAGALEGAPVEIVKARSVDAYAIAQSEWVIEGYIDTTQKVWESAECETAGDSVANFFPEWTGYMGRARRTYKFVATALTYRKDSPIFYTPLAHSVDSCNMGLLRDACAFELAERLIPGFVVDVNTLDGMLYMGGLVYQVRKRRSRDEGYQKNLLAAALGTLPGVRLVVVVDEDVDIYNADDVVWAICTRLDANTGMVRGSAGRGIDQMPLERRGSVAQSAFEGGLGIDATVPYDRKWLFKRSHYPVEMVDLRRWLTAEQIAAARAMQSEYSRLLARTGA